MREIPLYQGGLSQAAGSPVLRVGVSRGVRGKGWVGGGAAAAAL